MLKRVLTLIFFLSSSLSYSSSLFETLEKSFKLDKENYPKLIQESLKQNYKYSQIKDFSRVKFHPYFLDNLTFNNSNETLSLALRDECSLIDLLNTDLLHSSTGKIAYVLIQIKGEPGENNIHSLKKEKYLRLIGYKKCPGSLKLKRYFALKNLRKVLSQEKILFPTSLNACKETHKSFISNVKAPYLCDISNKILNLPKLEREFKNTSKSNFRIYTDLSRKVNETKSMKKIMNPGALDFLNNLCSNTDNSDKYCEDIFAETYWSNAVSGVVSQKPLLNFCRTYLKKEKLSTSDLKLCSNAFASKPSLCEQGISNAPSLTPMPNCKMISKALSFSRLYKDYNDCPLRVGEDSLITASRILTHLNKAPPIESKHCELNSITPFATFNADFLENELWKTSLCYEDKIRRKKVCLPTFLHDIKGSSLSLTDNMGKLLARLRGFNNREQKCNIITEPEYRPNLLQFKAGCYIIKEIKNCSALKCGFRVILDDQSFTNFSVKSNFKLDLFAEKYTKEASSLRKLIEKHYKKTSKKILNISSLKRIFKIKSQAVILAMGCLEELLPSHKKHQNFNQCSISSFIVDGIIEDNSSHSLIVRTPLDNIHAPRIIPWTRVFASVKNYQRFQPLKEWSFYAIY